MLLPLYLYTKISYILAIFSMFKKRNAEKKLDVAKEIEDI